MECVAVLADGNLVIRGGRVVSPGFGRKDSFRHRLSNVIVEHLRSQLYRKPRSHLKVVEIEDLIERWPGVHQNLTPLILLGDFLNHLGDSVRINGADAGGGMRNL